jgi:hypothetical protein
MQSAATVLPLTPAMPNEVVRLFEEIAHGDLLTRFIVASSSLSICLMIINRSRKLHAQSAADLQMPTVVNQSLVALDELYKALAKPRR